MSGAPDAAGGLPAIKYTWDKGREVGNPLTLYKAMRTKNTCKTCALGMGGQAGGMVNEAGHFPEVCKKSLQAQVADMAGPIPLDVYAHTSFDQMAQMTPRDLERAGRITTPLLAEEGDDRYTPISWARAMQIAGDAFAETTPDRSFFYFSGRSSNEAGFLLQLVARLWGTNNVNNCSYYCHQASGVGLASVTGSGTATVTLDDVEQCDTLFLIGGNPASNHPRFLTTLKNLKRRGGKVVVVNPLKELGLTRFRVPSDPRSLAFGTRIADEYLMPRIGGDIALLVGIAKVVIERGGTDPIYLRDFTDGAEEFIASATATSWADIEAGSGLTQAEIRAAAEVYLASDRTIFAWAMGITHHTHGVQNVQTLAALALLRGMVGRPGSGLLPLRGHSNVQGIGSVGVTPQLKSAIFDAIESRFDVRLPTSAGADTMQCMDAALAGDIDVAVLLGGNLYGSNPDSAWAQQAMSSIGTVIQMSTTLNTGHALGRGRRTLVLPVKARDEEHQATTQESMFNFVRLSDGGPDRYAGPRSEVEVIADLAERIAPGVPISWASMRDHATIRHAIAEIVPGYAAIADIDRTKNEFHIDGRIFHAPRFGTDTGRAKLHPIEIPPSPGEGDDRLTLMTIRSEGQFNTVVYEEEDVWRGQERRDIVLLNAEDMRARGIAEDQLVTVASTTGQMQVHARAFEIARTCAAMYYPEANVLVPRAVDGASRTPAFKNIPVVVTPAAIDTVIPAPQTT